MLVPKLRCPHLVRGVCCVEERLTLRILEWKDMQHNPKDRQRASNRNNYLSNYVSNQFDVQLPMISVFATHHHGKSCPIKSTNIVITTKSSTASLPCFSPCFLSLLWPGLPQQLHAAKQRGCPKV